MTLCVSRPNPLCLYPHAAGLDGPGYLVSLVRVASPHTSAQAIDSIVSDFDGLLLGFEGSHSAHWPEDLLLENCHGVVALENGWFDVKPSVHHIIFGTAREHLGPFVLADVNVILDAIKLFLGYLGAHHSCRIIGISGFNCFRTRNNPLHKFVVDVFLHQQPGLASAYLALIECKEHGTLDSLIEQLIILVGNGREIYVWTLAPQLHGHRDQFVR